MASLAAFFLYQRACGSVFDSGVSRKHFLPRAPVPTTVAPGLGTKLLRLAQASSIVPSTVKCSSLNKSWRRACCITAPSNRCATSPAINRSRFFVNTVASHSCSSIPKPTNQRNSKSYLIRSISCRSLRIAYSTCSSSARIKCSGGIDGRPRRA